MRVALMMNFIAPYRVRLFEEMTGRLSAFRVLISTPMESDRFWKPDWGTLDVKVQRNLTVRRRLRDPGGFMRTLSIHIPLDTIPQLWVYRPDVVVSVELGARSFQAALFRQLRPSVPLVIWCKLSEHTERGFGRVRDALRRFILRRADAVVVNGESGARYIAKFGVPDHAILRLNQPVDLRRFADAASRLRAASESISTEASGTTKAGIRRLLVVGTLNDRKGVLPFANILIDWANARHAHGLPPELEIIWLGDGERRPDLERLAWPANLRPVFLGNRGYDEVPEIYAAADLLVFPTMLDEWGLVVNEAMAAGLPVLGSIYAQAVDELVEDGVTGWQFDPTSTASVINALDSAIGASPETLAAMRAAAQQRISDITPEATAQKFVALLERLVSRQPKQARLVALRREEMN